MKKLLAFAAAFTTLYTAAFIHIAFKSFDYS